MHNLALAQRSNAESASQFPMQLPPMGAGPLPSEDFAVALGLKQPSSPNYTHPPDELARLNQIVYYKHHNGRFSHAQQDLVWTGFCALYLPATFEKFLDPPPVPDKWRKELLINNAYFELLSSIQHSPYFYKYLRSTKPLAANNKIITKVLVERFLDLAPEWDVYFQQTPADRPRGYYNDTAAAVLQLLASFLAAFAKNKDQEAVLPSATRSKLIPWLRKWERRHRSEFLGEVASRNLGILSGNQEFSKGVRLARRMMRGWEECGMERCKKKEDLKACARCQTVRYCSPEHQKAHWSLPGDAHKQHCFKTDY